MPGQAIGYIILALILIAIAAWPVWREMRNGLLAAPAPTRTIPVNRIAAVLTWAAGVGTTYLFVSASTGAPVWLCAVVALLAQAVLTLAERPTLNGRPSLVSAGALALDTILNAGGLFAPMQRLGSTPPGQMITAVTGQSGVSPIAALAVALVLGALIAALPEWFWRQRH